MYIATAMMGLPVVWRQVCPNVLSSSGLVVPLQCPHSVTGLAVEFHSISLLGVEIQEAACEEMMIPYQHLSPCGANVILSVGTNERDYIIRVP